MKKLLFILSLFITSNLFAQVNTGKKVIIKVGGGGGVSQHYIDSLLATGYYTIDQIDSIVAQLPSGGDGGNADSLGMKPANYYFTKTTKITDSSWKNSNDAGTKGTVVLLTGVSGSGSSGTSTSYVKQTYTSGSSVTVNNATTWLVINPTSTISSLTITLPASPSDGQIIRISFGGTITTGTVITTLTISPNTGQTILQTTTPTSTNAGSTISYQFNVDNLTYSRLY